MGMALVVAERRMVKIPNNNNNNKQQQTGLFIKSNRSKIVSEDFGRFY